MKKNLVLWGVVIAAFCGQAFVGVTPVVDAAALEGGDGLLEREQPNIVFFIADDVSQEDFGCYGHPTIKTPNTDSLAASGMRFE